MPARLPLINRVPDVDDKDRLRRFCDEVTQILNGLLISGAITLTPGGGGSGGGATLGLVSGDNTALPGSSDGTPITGTPTGILYIDNNNRLANTTTDVTFDPSNSVFQPAILFCNAVAGVSLTFANTAADLVTGVLTYLLEQTFSVSGYQTRYLGLSDSTVGAHIFLPKDPGSNTYTACVTTIKSVASSISGDIYQGVASDETTVLFKVNATGIVSSIGGIITSASASAFTVGLAGATNPAFQVDSSTALQAAGLKVTGAVAAGTVALSVVSSGAAANLSLDALGAGTLTIAGTSSGAITLGRNTGVTGTVTVTSTSASALTVGRQGATNPVLKIDASTGTVLTGLSIKGATTGSTGTAVAVISSANNEPLQLDAKGSGIITVAGVSTGAITLGRNTGVTGTLTVTSTSISAFAVGATGATNPAFLVQSVASQVNGITITAAATGNGVTLASTGSDTDIGLNIAAKGAGLISFTATTPIQFSVNTKFRQMYGASGAPSAATGTGAGTNATASVTGNDCAGTITVNTSNLDTPAATATIATITFFNGYLSAPYIVLIPANAATWALTYGTSILIQANVTTAHFLLESGATPLPALTTATYKWNYMVIG